MNTEYMIKAETADALRAAAPALGLTVDTTKNVVAPGVELMVLDPFTAMKFDSMRETAKIGVDAMIKRIARNAMKTPA